MRRAQPCLWGRSIIYKCLSLPKIKGSLPLSSRVWSRTNVIFVDAAAHWSFAWEGFAERRFRMSDNIRCSRVGWAATTQHPTTGLTIVGAGSTGVLSVWNAHFDAICIWTRNHFAVYYLCDILTWIFSLRHHVRCIRNYIVSVHSDELHSDAPSTLLPKPYTVFKYAFADHHWRRTVVCGSIADWSHKFWMWRRLVDRLRFRSVWCVTCGR